MTLIDLDERRPGEGPHSNLDEVAHLFGEGHGASRKARTDRAVKKTLTANFPGGFTSPADIHRAMVLIGFTYSGWNSKKTLEEVIEIVTDVTQVSLDQLLIYKTGMWIVECLKEGCEHPIGGETADSFHSLRC